MKDVLFFTVAFGEYDCKLAKLVVESLRISGFSGDVVVFTDRPCVVPFATCVNVAAHKQAKLLLVNSPTYHSRNSSGLDYLLMRLLPQFFYDTSPFQYLFYVDTDVLFFKNPCPIWLDPNCIFLQQDCMSLWFNLSWVQHLFSVDRASTEGKPGYCGGLYCFPRNFWFVLEEWRELFTLVSPAERQRITDQRFLNYLLWKKGYPVKIMKEVSTRKRVGNAWATHYWQNAHDAMKADYLATFRSEMNEIAPANWPQELAALREEARIGPLKMEEKTSSQGSPSF